MATIPGGIVFYALAMSGKCFCSTIWPGKCFMMLLTIAVALSVFSEGCIPEQIDV